MDLTKVMGNDHNWHVGLIMNVNKRLRTADVYVPYDLNRGCHVGMFQSSFTRVDGMPFVMLDVLNELDLADHTS